MAKLPKDDSNRVTGAKGRQLVHSAFPAERWEYREITGVDRGIDCEIELVENDEFTGKKIQGQIKGTSAPKKLKTENAFSFPFETKTILYALNQPSAFVLFYADVVAKAVYYLPIQDYFIANPAYFDKLDTTQEKINVHIPCDNVVSEEDFDLQQIAKSVYIDGPTKTLRRAI